MKHEIMTKSLLKEKSAETGIPFANMLAGYVMEEIMFLIMESPYVSSLWLKDSNRFGIANYRRMEQPAIHFVYHADEKMKKAAPSQQLFENMAILDIVKDIFDPEKVSDIRWRYQCEKKEAEYQIYIRAVFEEMMVPITISISRMDYDGQNCEKKELVSSFHPKEKGTYLHYPMEIFLAEQLFSMIKYLELIPEMDAYQLVYNMIKHEAVDGRHIREILGTLCKKEKITADEQRLKLLLTYPDYTYMKKRWEKFYKKQRKVHPEEEISEWKELMEYILAFLAPIWQSICQDEIFFGDWMPELGRYLE